MILLHTAYALKNKVHLETELAAPPAMMCELSLLRAHFFMSWFQSTIITLLKASSEKKETMIQSTELVG